MLIAATIGRIQSSCGGIFVEEWMEALFFSMLQVTEKKGFGEGEELRKARKAMLSEVRACLADHGYPEDAFNEHLQRFKKKNKNLLRFVDYKALAEIILLDARLHIPDKFVVDSHKIEGEGKP